MPTFGYQSVLLRMIARPDLVTGLVLHIGAEIQPLTSCLWDGELPLATALAMCLLASWRVSHHSSRAQVVQIDDLFFHLRVRDMLSFRVLSALDPSLATHACSFPVFGTTFVIVFVAE